MARRGRVDLTSRLEGTARLAPRPLFWHYPHYGNQGGFPGGAILEGDWKWIERYGEGGEFYDIANDPGEARDVAADHPGRAKALAARLETWRRRVDAKLPSANPLAGR